LAGIVASVYTDYGITSYVIGLPGADFNWIAKMNQQGGWDCVATDSCPMGGSEFLEALEMIRDSH
jgi:hypothetical protein